jgi:hypothetical protein
VPLPEPREGESLEFHSHAQADFETTIGHPEQIIWSSIKHMGVDEVADVILYDFHMVANSKVRSTIAKNLQLYIGQAFELYESARNAKANTAPLLYYYSFLNLAKAVCEIYHPRFHEKPECYRHGISWQPNREYMVNMRSESVSLASRGVWHVLYEAVAQRACRVPNPCKLNIRQLFALAPELGSEYERTYHQLPHLILLHNPDVLVNGDKEEVWLRFSVEREDLRNLRFFGPKLLDSITTPTIAYREVRSTEEDFRTFELEHSKKIPHAHERPLRELVMPEVRAMNPFAYLESDGLKYAIPIQTQLPLQLPQLLVLYSLMFWLGSLVRYDPHSVAHLQDTEHWILIDGFINQSRLWLLELFEWELYKFETTLHSVR